MKRNSLWNGVAMFREFLSDSDVWNLEMVGFVTSGLVSVGVLVTILVLLIGAIRIWLS